MYQTHEVPAPAPGVPQALRGLRKEAAPGTPGAGRKHDAGRVGNHMGVMGIKHHHQ